MLYRHTMALPGIILLIVKNGKINDESGKIIECLNKSKFYFVELVNRRADSGEFFWRNATDGK